MATAAHRLSLCWVTDTTGTEHAVTGTDMADTIADRLGEYRGICGIRFHPASLAACPTSRCQRCTNVLRIHRTETLGRHCAA